MTQSPIFLLERILDNPLYEGFGLSDAPSVLGRELLIDDMTPGFDQTAHSTVWQPVRFGKKWPRPAVDGRVTEFNDYPCINLLLPALSGRACKALDRFLRPHAELLPLETKSGRYFFCNITTVVDALDKRKARCDYFPGPARRVMTVHQYELKPAAIAGLSIFRTLDDPYAVLVSAEFVECAHAAHLNGFAFSRIWPLPKKTDYKKTWKAQRTATRAMAQHALIIAIDTRVRMKGSVLTRMEEELDAILLVPSADAPYYGCYQGHDRVASEHRMFLSCPDVDALVAKLLPWLKRLRENVRVKAVMKRWGHYTDATAREERCSFAS